MAKLLVAPEILLGALFHGAAPGVRLVHAYYDPGLQAVVLDIEGGAVPAAPAVAAIISHTPEAYAVAFHEIPPPAALANLQQREPE